MAPPPSQPLVFSSVSGQVVRVLVHPVALFSIVDSHERRPLKGTHVIGTLLGTHDGHGTVEVSACYTVPHKESGDEVAMDMEYAHDMAGLCRVSNDLEVVVGWFSTAGDLSPPSILIHDFYTRQTPALRKNAAPCPIVLLVNCDLKLGPQGLSIQAMYCKEMGTPGRTRGFIFAPLPVQIKVWPEEETGLRHSFGTILGQEGLAHPLSDLEDVTRNVGHMTRGIALLENYVEAVHQGLARSDPAVGRRLLSLLQLMRPLTESVLETFLNGKIKDVLMVLYLSKLLATQTLINEKLTLLAPNQPAQSTGGGGGGAY